MRGNPLKIFFAVFIGLPIVATVILQLFGTVMMVSVAHQVQSGGSDADRPVKSKYKVDNVQGDRSLRAGFKALSNVSALSEDRQVSVSTQVALKDLLDPGEAKPDPDFAHVFVKARAPRLAKEECARLRKTLASECVVERATAGKAYDGLYRVSMTLNFIQRDSFGEVEQADTHSYHEIRERLPISGRTIKAMPASAGKKREALYAEAARLCSKLRASEGNCAIYHVQVSERADRKSSAVELSGHVRLSFLQKSAGF